MMAGRVVGQALRGETAIVTGATSGIGEAIAKRFAADGARVAVIGRDAQRGENVVRSITEDGGHAAFFAADLTSDATVQKMVSGVLDTFGDFGIVVNNAGLSRAGTVVQTGPEEWDSLWRINVSSVYLVSHRAMPHLLQRGGGSVINVSSEAGLKGLKDRAAYCAAKSAVVGLTKAMAVDHSPCGVRVNCICPGTIGTPMISRMIASSADPGGLREAFLQRRLTPYLGTPEDVAEAAVYLALPRNRYVTGAILSVDGGSLAR